MCLPPFVGGITGAEVFRHVAAVLDCSPLPFICSGPPRSPETEWSGHLENVDFSVFKQFAITERWRVEFRSEFFNVFNHANFTNPSSSITPASIGSFGKVFNTVTDPREIQFALKLYFN